MTRYLPLAANIAGVLLIMCGAVALEVCAFVYAPPGTGWALLAAAAVSLGRRLARVEAGE